MAIANTHYYGLPVQPSDSQTVLRFCRYAINSWETNHWFSSTDRSTISNSPPFVPRNQCWSIMFRWFILRSCNASLTNRVNLCCREYSGLDFIRSIAIATIKMSQQLRVVFHWRCECGAQGGRRSMRLGDRLWWNFILPYLMVIYWGKMWEERKIMHRGHP